MLGFRCYGHWQHGNSQHLHFDVSTDHAKVSREPRYLRVVVEKRGAKLGAETRFPLSVFDITVNIL